MRGVQLACSQAEDRHGRTHDRENTQELAVSMSSEATPVVVGLQTMFQI
jgi:hypothetical protein